MELGQDAKLPKPDTAFPKKKLKRRIARKVLTRIENAARTQSDFENVIKTWDKLSENEVRQVSNNEFGWGNSTLDWDMTRDGIIFPHPESTAVHQAQRGDFLDLIDDCLLEMYELVEDLDISKLISQMEAKHIIYVFLKKVLCRFISSEKS